MAKSVNKEKVGRPKIDSSSDSIKTSVRIPETILKKIDSLDIGKNTSDKLRFLIEQGLEKVLNEQGK
ncbi:MAG: hypothetical protein JXM74_01700 [Fusobacteriaceae bacterium]|nr:hypothetical protein [Fusobacteriaceae bacterium]MBN2837448.1 hypothetical protein [Fusobacteriaceae bacterium]